MRKVTESRHFHFKKKLEEAKNQGIKKTVNKLKTAQNFRGQRVDVEEGYVSGYGSAQYLNSYALLGSSSKIILQRVPSCPWSSPRVGAWVPGRNTVHSPPFLHLLVFISSGN